MVFAAVFTIRGWADSYLLKGAAGRLQYGSAVGFLRIVCLLIVSLYSLLSCVSTDAATQGGVARESTATMRITVNILPKVTGSAQMLPNSVNLRSGTSSSNLCGTVGAAQKVNTGVRCAGRTQLPISQAVPSVNKKGHLVFTITPL